MLSIFGQIQIYFKWVFGLDAWRVHLRYWNARFEFLCHCHIAVYYQPSLLYPFSMPFIRLIYCIYLYQFNCHLPSHLPTNQIQNKQTQTSSVSFNLIRRKCARNIKLLFSSLITIPRFFYSLLVNAIRTWVSVCVPFTHLASLAFTHFSLCRAFALLLTMHTSYMIFRFGCIHVTHVCSQNNYKYFCNAIEFGTHFNYVRFLHLWSGVQITQKCTHIKQECI